MFCTASLRALVALAQLAALSHATSGVRVPFYRRAEASLTNSDGTVNMGRLAAHSASVRTSLSKVCAALASQFCVLTNICI